MTGLVAATALLASNLVASNMLASALVASINAARVAAGRPALQPLPAELAARNSAYLRPVLEAMLRAHVCDHDLGRWQAMQAEAAQEAYPLMPTSEVIACPRSSGSWNPSGIVRDWLASPLHRGILLNRPRVSHVDCLGLESGGRSVAMCTLWAPARR